MERKKKNTMVVVAFFFIYLKIEEMSEFARFDSTSFKVGTLGAEIIFLSPLAKRA